jgi:hypothetical protein
MDITHRIDVKLFLPSVREVGAAVGSYSEDAPYEIYLDRECTYNGVYSFEEASFDYFYSADTATATTLRKNFFNNFLGQSCAILRSIDPDSRVNFWMLGVGGKIMHTSGNYGNRAVIPVFVVG